MYVVPDRLALADHARLAPRERRLDQERELNGVAVGEAVLEERPRSHAEDQRRAHNERAQVAYPIQMSAIHPHVGSVMYRARVSAPWLSASMIAKSTLRWNAVSGRDSISSGRES